MPESKTKAPEPKKAVGGNKAVSEKPVTASPATANPLWDALALNLQPKLAMGDVRPTGDGSAGSQQSLADAEARLGQARTARKAAEARLAAAAQPGLGQNETDVWVVQQQKPSVDVAEARLSEARAAHDVAEARRAAGPATGPDASRLGREEAEANAIVGDAESALGQALTQAVRARRVGEGLADMRARTARRGAAGAPGPGGGTPVAPGGSPTTGGPGAPKTAGGGAPTGAGGPQTAGMSTANVPTTTPANPAPLTKADIPTDDDLDARLDAIESHGSAEPHTLVRTPAAGLADVDFTEAGSKIQAGNVSGATVHEGPVPLEGEAGAPTRTAPAPPETWLLDPARANLTDPDEIADAQFRPNRSGRNYDVRNVQVTAGPGGDKIATPSGPSFGENRVVGGARDASLDTTSGTWRPGQVPYHRPYNPLGQAGPFAEQSATDWSKWEQSHGPLDESQRYALWFYSDDLSEHLNRALRGQRPGQFVTNPVALEAVASDLDKSMKPVPVDTVVYRKTSISHFADLGVTDPAQLTGMTGRSYSHAGYTSTAIVGSGRWSGDIDIVIQVPKGTRGRYMGGENAAVQQTNPVRPAPGAPTASMPGEMEFLVERGTSFKIEKVEFDQASGRWRVEVRIAEQGVKPTLTNPVPLPGTPGPSGAAPTGAGPAPGAPGSGPTTASQPSVNKPAETVPPPVESADDIRARQVAEGLADMKAKAAIRVERIKVEPIDDPDVAARAFVEGKGGAGGNSHMSRKFYESQWRYFHHQLTDPPAAGWRRADGTVVVDASNPKVREAIERLAKERKAAPAVPAAPAPVQPHVGAVAGPLAKDATEKEEKKPGSPQAAAPDQTGEPTGAGAQGQGEKKPKVATDVDFNVNKAQVTVKVGAPKPEEPTTNAPQKPKTAPEVAVNVSPKEIGGNVDVMRHTAGGTQHGATAGGSYEFATGNTQATLGYKVATKGGSSGSISLTGGNSVTVEEPEEVAEDVWVVSYVVSDSSGIAAGATGKSGGADLSVTGSETKATLHTGSRKFSTEAEAIKFKKNIRDVLEGEKALEPYFPPTSVHGAMRIPPGESRGVGGSDTLAGGISAGYSTGYVSGSLGKSGYKSSTHLLSIYHEAGYKVQVTTTVSTEKGSAWTASGLGLSNESGGSQSALYAVTFAFDLSNAADQQAFETFCRLRLPFADGRKPHSLRMLTTQEDHDKYTLAGGDSTFAGSTSQEKVLDAQGEHDNYTGKQTEDHNPGLILGLFEDEKHASAEIVSSLLNGKEEGFAAKMKVSGESGEFNRRQFGKIFEGAKFSGDATKSGKWTLTAQIPAAAVHALEQNSDKFRNAKTQDEKLRIYSELVKDNGAQMLGGQVGMSSLSWNLELKGDENFPGERGRAKLNALRMQLTEQLKGKPDSAYSVARDAKETLERLDKRFKAVSDPSKYTDLPDGLREEQLQVIRVHRSEFIDLRQRALTKAGEFDPNEKIEDVERRASSKHGYDEFDKNQLARIMLQDSLKLNRRAMEMKHTAMVSSSEAIAKVRTSPGVIQFRRDVDQQTMLNVTSTVEDKVHEVWVFERQQAGLEKELKLLQEKWDHETDPEPRLVAMRAIEQKVRERLVALTQEFDKLVEIGELLYPVANFSAMQKRPTFWQSVSAPREEKPDETPMAL